ncbi:MAG: pentapeptide repeat-containing protein, partial [Bacteroidota bacterium]
MCKHKYKTPEFNRSNCKIEEIIDKLIESGEENILDHIPYDNDGLCIFHSPKLEWKQELNVMNYLRRLIKGISKLNENNGDYLNYTFAEYNLLYKDQHSDELNDLTFDTYCDFRGAIFNNTIQIRNASFNSANFKGAV